jgi:hypothetical protein
LRVFLVCGDIYRYYYGRLYYRNGGKTRENIPFEIKKMIDSKGMDSEGMEGNPRKIFGYKV